MFFLGKKVKVEESDFTFIDDKTQTDQIVVEAVFELSAPEKEKLQWNAGPLKLNIYVKKT